MTVLDCSIKGIHNFHQWQCWTVFYQRNTKLQSVTVLDCVLSKEYITSIIDSVGLCSIKGIHNFHQWQCWTVFYQRNTKLPSVTVLDCVLSNEEITSTSDSVGLCSIKGIHNFHQWQWWTVLQLCSRPMLGKWLRCLALDPEEGWLVSSVFWMLRG